MVLPQTTQDGIKELVEGLGKSQTAIADAMGISPAQMSRLINGQRAWRISTKKLFCMATGVSMARLDAALNGNGVGVA